MEGVEYHYSAVNVDDSFLRDRERNKKEEDFVNKAQCNENDRNRLIRKQRRRRGERHTFQKKKTEQREIENEMVTEEGWLWLYSERVMRRGECEGVGGINCNNENKKRCFREVCAIREREREKSMQLENRSCGWLG